MKLPNFASLTEQQAREYLESVRWPHGIQCPHCKLWKVTRIKGKSARPGLFQCNHSLCREQFTVSVGTIFEDSHLPLNKWIHAFHMMCSSKKGISALQLSRTLGVTYKTAWHMAHRIRYAMKDSGSDGLLKGTVEVDETYVGGRTRLSKRGRGSERKTPVVALVERNGKVRTTVVSKVSSRNLRAEIQKHVDENAAIMTDEYGGYRDIGDYFFGGHQTVNHSKNEYARGIAHVNTAESFFALLKRGVYGSFHHVSRKHLPRYCDEFAFRWNYRQVTDAERTQSALRLAEGKRLVYRRPMGA